MRASNSGGTIYAIGVEGSSLVKIGSTRGDVEQRAKILQTGQPFVLRVLASVTVEADVQRIEHHLHTLLSHVHRRGEWFEIVVDASTLEALVLQAIQHVLTVNDEYAASSRPRRGSASVSVLGTPIREARLRAGLTQYALAKAIGISKTAMNDIEQGKTANPGVVHIIAIADTLRLSVDALLGRKETVHV
jgi:DNA-binding XRE family transcriptional regulator